MFITASTTPIVDSEKVGPKMSSRTYTVFQDLGSPEEKPLVIIERVFNVKKET